MDSSNTPLIQRLPLKEISAFYGDNLNFFACQGIFMAHGVDVDGIPTFLQPGSIYRTDENRVLYLEKGRARAVFNMMPATIEAGSIVYAGRGTMIQIESVDERLTVYGIAADNTLTADSDGAFMAGNVRLSEQQEQFVKNFWQTIAALRQVENFPKDVLVSMAKAYLTFAQNAVKEQEKTLSDGGGRAYEIFRKFISLVNCNAVKERNIAFYADTLCISPNYLCSLIKQASGETVMQWIDKQIVLEAKALLLRGGSSIWEISETLNFANPSFFSKFFKRQTGMTPGEFKATSPHSVFR